MSSGGDLHLFDRSQLEVLDVVIIVLYFLAVLAVGIWVGEMHTFLQKLPN